MPPSIQSVLRSEITYSHFRCLPELDRQPNPASLVGRYKVTPQALDIINKACPVLLKLTIGLERISDYCTTKGISAKCAPSSEAKKSIDALAQFSTLRHLELHFKLEEEQLQLMYPREGCQAARTFYNRVQASKKGARLESLSIVFYTLTNTIFGACDYYGPIVPNEYPRLDVTMTCRLWVDGNTEPGQMKEDLILSCDLPIFGRILDRKKQAERLLGDVNSSNSWRRDAGPRTWKRIRKEWPHPSSMSLFVAKATTLPSVLAWSVVIKGRKVGARLIGIS